LIGGDFIKLESVRIKNFRNINDLDLKFSDFNVLVGENNVGKTNILRAIYKILNMNESPRSIKFSEEDFYVDTNTHKRAVKLTIQINFVELDEINEVAFVSAGIDIENKKLSIKLIAEWDEDNNEAKVEIFFLRDDDSDNIKGKPFEFKHKKFIPFHYIDAYRDVWRETQHSKGDLKQIFKDYNKNFLKPIETQLKSSVEIISLYIDHNESIDVDLLDYLTDIHSELISETPKFNAIDLNRIPSELSSLKENITNIKHKIDIQNKLIELQSIVNGLESMDEIRSLLEDNLSLFVPTNSDLNLELGKIEETDLLDDSKIYLEDTPILKQGTGFQNSFVIALKISRLLSNIKFSREEITNLIIALEEPEAHMHPHLQRSFINKLKKKQNEWLEDFKINVQFIITTHSPFVISQVNKSEISVIKKYNNEFFITRLDDQFFTNICKDIPGYRPKEKLKHFDNVFRAYPEIFLSRGVIIVEGQSEYGALPEMAKIIPNIDLDELGLSLIYVDGKKTLKMVYIILKQFTTCLAIRDKDLDGNDDDYLLRDEDEPYETTDLPDFEHEIVNTMDNLSIIKKILMQSFEDGCYLGLIRKYVPETQNMNNQEILDCWDDLELEDLKLNIDENLLIDTLQGNKTSLFWSNFCSDMKEEEIPACYKKLFTKARDLVI